MGCIDTITYDKFPKQKDENYKYPEFKVGSRVEVCYHYDTSKYHYGTIVRDDLEEPFETIIKLDNGRYLRAVECQYSYIDEEVSDNMCEWKRLNWFVGCDGCKVKHNQGNYCPRCEKKDKGDNNKQVTVAMVGNSKDTAVNLIHKVMNGKYDDL